MRQLPARWGVPVDYDEGVYVTGAALLSKGLLPYRDYVFLHPPGILLFLFPWGLGGPLFTLGAARLLSSLLGATSAVLMVRLVGGRAALPVALLWILWPELVSSERGAFLEPLMNCAGLAALVMLKDAPGPKRATLSGVLCAGALLVKVWGGLWCLAAFLLCPKPLRHRLVLAAAGAFGLVMVPFLIASGTELVRQVLLAHWGRPPDGDLSLALRLDQMFVDRNVCPAILAALAVPLVILRGGPGRVALLGFGLLSAGFLSAAAYWNQYNAALIPFELWLIGSGLNLCLDALPARWWRAGALAACAAVLPSRRLAVGRPPSTAAQQAAVEPLRTQASELCAFEVLELVLVDRLPALTRPALVDSYGQMLLDAQEGGQRYQSATAAFASEAAQSTLRRQLETCPGLRTGWRGDWQMNATTKAQVQGDFQQLGEGLYQRRLAPP